MNPREATRIDWSALNDLLGLKDPGVGVEVPRGMLPTLDALELLDTRSIMARAGRTEAAQAAGTSVLYQQFVPEGEFWWLIAVSAISNDNTVSSQCGVSLKNGGSFVNLLGPPVIGSTAALGHQSLYQPARGILLSPGDGVCAQFNNGAAVAKVPNWFWAYRLLTG